MSPLDSRLESEDLNKGRVVSENLGTTIDEKDKFFITNQSNV